MAASINTFYHRLSSRCNLNAYFSMFLKELINGFYTYFFSTSSNILNTSSDNQTQVEKLLKSLIKKGEGVKKAIKL